MFRPKPDDELIPSDPAERLWFRLLRVHYLMFRRVSQVFQQYGVTPPQFAVLRRLMEDEGLMQQTLAEKLRVTKGNVSQMLKVMERDGLIERTPEGASKQSILTDKARAVLEELIPAHTQFVRTQLSSFSQAEQSQLLELLKKLEASLT